MSIPKFRIWHKVQKKFFYPSDNISVEFYGGGAFFVHGPSHEGPQTLGTEKDCEVQYTCGVLDAKNQDIYFGDIVKYTFNGYRHHQRVRSTDFHNLWELTSRLKNVRVVGNYLENPELEKKMCYRVK